MKHFSVWQWTDFVRGLIGDEGGRSRMATHLSSGCPRCQGMVKVLGGIATLAPSDADYEPPEHAIRYAQAIYSLYQPESVSFSRLLARLVHDSLLAPLPAGMRAQSRGSRRTLHEAGTYCIDLQTEHEPGSGQITLVGQVADRNKGAMSPRNLPVWLMDRKSLVARTVCNGLGEFHLQYAPVPNLRLNVLLPSARKRLEVSLKGLTPARPSGARSARIGLRPARRSSRRSK